MPADLVCSRCFVARSWCRTGVPSAHGWWRWRAARQRGQPACRCVPLALATPWHAVLWRFGCQPAGISACPCTAHHSPPVRVPSWNRAMLSMLLLAASACSPCYSLTAAPLCVAGPRGALGSRADAAGARLPAGGAAPRGAGHVQEHGCAAWAGQTALVASNGFWPNTGSLRRALLLNRFSAAHAAACHLVQRPYPLPCLVAPLLTLFLHLQSSCCWSTRTRRAAVAWSSSERLDSHSVQSDASATRVIPWRTLLRAAVYVPAPADPAVPCCAPASPCSMATPLLVSQLGLEEDIAGARGAPVACRAQFLAQQFAKPCSVR